jgi:hypothetical protein
MKSKKKGLFTSLERITLKYNFRFLFFTKIKIGGVYV